mgnify:CR=1 FL=1
MNTYIFNKEKSEIVLDIKKHVCILGIYPCTIAGNKKCECYEFNNRPRYHVSKELSDSWEDGKKVVEGTDFTLKYDKGCSRHHYLHPDEKCDGVDTAVPLR